jgi:hypothetical protein
MKFPKGISANPKGRPKQEPKYKMYALRLPLEQIEWLQSLPKGEATTIIREFLTEKMKGRDVSFNDQFWASLELLQENDFENSSVGEMLEELIRSHPRARGFGI